MGEPIKLAQDQGRRSGGLDVIRGRPAGIQPDEAVIPKTEQGQQEGTVRMNREPERPGSRAPVQWNSGRTALTTQELSPNGPDINAFMRRMPSVAPGAEPLSFAAAAERFVPVAEEIRSSAPIQAGDKYDWAVRFFQSGDDLVSRSLGEGHAFNREQIARHHSDYLRGKNSTESAQELMDELTTFDDPLEAVVKSAMVMSAQGYFDPMVWASMRFTTAEQRFKNHERLMEQRRQNGETITPEQEEAAIRVVAMGEHSLWEANEWKHRAGLARMDYSGTAEFAFREASAVSIERLILALQQQDRLGAIQDPILRRQIQADVAGFLNQSILDLQVTDPAVRNLGERWRAVDMIARILGPQGDMSMERSVSTVRTTRDVLPLIGASIALAPVGGYGLPFAILYLGGSHFANNSATAAGQTYFGDGTFSENMWDATRLTADQTLREIPYLLGQRLALGRLGGGNWLRMGAVYNLSSAPMVYGYDRLSPGIFDYEDRIDYRPDKSIERFIAQDLIAGTFFSIIGSGLGHKMMRLQGLAPGTLPVNPTASQRMQHLLAHSYWGAKFVGLETVEFAASFGMQLFMLHDLQMDRAIIEQKYPKFKGLMDAGDGRMVQKIVPLDESTYINAFVNALIMSLPGKMNGYRMAYQQRAQSMQHIALQAAQTRINQRLSAQGLDYEVQLRPVLGDVNSEPMTLSQRNGRNVLTVPVGLGTEGVRLPSPRDKPNPNLLERGALGMQTFADTIFGVRLVRGLTGDPADTRNNRVAAGRLSADEALVRIQQEAWGNVQGLDLGPVKGRVSAYLEQLELQAGSGQARALQNFRKAMLTEMDEIYVSARTARVAMGEMTAEEAADPRLRAARRAQNYIEYAEEELGRVRVLHERKNRLSNPSAADGEINSKTRWERWNEAAKDYFAERFAKPWLLPADIFVNGPRALILGGPVAAYRGLILLNERARSRFETFSQNHPVLAEPLRLVIAVLELPIDVLNGATGLASGLYRTVYAGATLPFTLGSAGRKLLSSPLNSDASTEWRFGRVGSEEGAAEIYRYREEARNVLRIGQQVEAELRQQIDQLPPGAARTELEASLALVQQRNTGLQREGITHFDSMLRGYGRGGSFTFLEPAQRVLAWVIPSVAPKPALRGLLAGRGDSDVAVQNQVRAAFDRAWSGGYEFEADLLRQGVVARCRGLINSNDKESAQQLSNHVASIRNRYNQVVADEMITELFNHARAQQGNSKSNAFGLDQKVLLCSNRGVRTGNPAVDGPEPDPDLSNITPREMHLEFVRGELVHRLKTNQNPQAFTENLRLLFDSYEGASARFDGQLQGVLKKLGESLPGNDPRIVQLRAVEGLEGRLVRRMLEGAPIPLEQDITAAMGPLGEQRMRRILHNLAEFGNAVDAVHDGMLTRAAAVPIQDVARPAPTMRALVRRVLQNNGLGFEQDEGIQAVLESRKGVAKFPDKEAEYTPAHLDIERRLGDELSRVLGGVDRIRLRQFIESVPDRIDRLHPLQPNATTVEPTIWSVRPQQNVGGNGRGRGPRGPGRNPNNPDRDPGNPTPNPTGPTADPTQGPGQGPTAGTPPVTPISTNSLVLPRTPVDYSSGSYQGMQRPGSTSELGSRF